MSDTSVTQQHAGANSLVIRSAIVASIGGLIFGFDTAVISGTTTSLERVYGLTSSGLGFTVAIATIGTIVGAIFAGQARRQVRPPQGAVRHRRLLPRRCAGYRPGTRRPLRSPSSCSSGSSAASASARRACAHRSTPLRSPRRPNVAAWSASSSSTSCSASCSPTCPTSSSARSSPMRPHWRWMFGVMAVAGGDLPAAAVHRSRDSALADGPRTRSAGPCRSAASCCTTVEESDLQISEIRDSLRRTPPATRDQGAVLHQALPQGDPAGLRDRHVQPAVRHQRDPLLRSRRHAAGGRQHRQRVLPDERRQWAS